MKDPRLERAANDNASETKDEDPEIKNWLGDEHGDVARTPHPKEGRTAELRGGERMRGDSGGGAREDGVPDVPHSYEKKKGKRADGNAPERKGS